MDMEKLKGLRCSDVAKLVNKALDGGPVVLFVFRSSKEEFEDRRLVTDAGSSYCGQVTPTGLAAVEG